MGTNFSVCLMCFLFVGCASFRQNSFQRTNNDFSGTYFESAYDDKNRAPASVLPPDYSFEQNSLTIDPLYLQTQADFHFARGESLSLEGQHQNAIESFKTTLVYDPQSAMVRRRLSTEYFKQGLIHEGLKEAQEAVSLKPQDVESRLLLAALYSSLKIYPKALKEYEYVLQIDPKNSEAPIYMGAIYSEMKQFDSAIASFQKLKQLEDYSSPHLPYYYIGRVHNEREKNSHLAIENFKKSLELKPDHLDSILNLSQILIAKKQYHEAIQAMTLYNQQNGPVDKVVEMLVQVYILQEDYDSAYESLSILEVLNPDDLNVKMKMALIMIEKKFYVQASEKLENILAQAPESDKVRFYLGAVYSEMSQFDQSLLHYQKLESSSSFYSEATLQSVQILKSRNQYEEALKLTTDAIHLKKTDPQLYILKISLLDELKQYDEALKIILQAQQEFPQNSTVQFYKGIIYDRLGQKKEVEAAMLSAIELDDKNAQAYNYLAYFWAEEGIHLDEALSFAKKANELKPQDGYILDTLGWIYFKKTDLAKAVQILEMAFKLQPDVSIIAEHLGDVYAKKLMSVQAKNLYEKALQLEKDDIKIKQIKNKILALESNNYPKPYSRGSASTESEK